MIFKWKKKLSFNVDIDQFSNKRMPFLMFEKNLTKALRKSTNLKSWIYSMNKSMNKYVFRLSSKFLLCKVFVHIPQYVIFACFKCNCIIVIIIIAWEFKKLWNMKVTIIPNVTGAFGTVSKGLLKGLEDLEIGGRVETIQTTAILRTVRILRRVLETWGDLLALKLLWKTIS